MSTNHTPNYSLSQWERSDKVQMDDFNADNARIDAALAAKADKSALNSLSSTVSGHAAALAGAMPGTSERVVLSVLEQPKTQAAILRLAEDALESRGLCLRLLGMRFQPSRPAPAPVRQRLHFSHELEEALLDSLSAYLRAAVAMKEGER